MKGQAEGLKPPVPHLMCTLLKHNSNGGNRTWIPHLLKALLCLMLLVILHPDGSSQTRFRYIGLSATDPDDWSDLDNWEEEDVLDSDVWNHPASEIPGNGAHFVIIQPQGADIYFHNLPAPAFLNFGGRQRFFLNELDIRADGSNGVFLPAEHPNMLYIIGRPLGQQISDIDDTHPNWNNALGLDPDDFLHLKIAPGAILYLGGGVTDYGAEWNIPTGSQARIEGSLILLGGSTGAVNNRFTALAANAIDFVAGSYCQIGVSGETSTKFSSTDFPFGTGTPNHTHVFQSGSLLRVHDGLTPFGELPSNTTVPTIHKIDMQPGSTFDFQNNLNGANYLPDIFGRTFGNYTYSAAVGKEVRGRSAETTIRNKLRVTNQITPELRFMNNNGAGSEFCVLRIHEGIEVPNANLGIITNEFLHFAPSSATGLEPGPFAGQLQMFVEIGANAEITGQSTIFFSERANFRLEESASLILNSYIRKASGSVPQTPINSLQNIGMANNTRIRFVNESYILGESAARFVTTSNNVIEIESANGIHTSGGIGHLRMNGFLATGLGAGTHFIYRGSVHQLMGNGPGNNPTLSPQNKRITINNPVGVTLSHDLSTSQLILTNGLLNLNGRTITIRPPAFANSPTNFGQVSADLGNFSNNNGTILFLGKNVVNIEMGRGALNFRTVIIRNLVDGATNFPGTVNFGNITGSFSLINNLLQLEDNNNTTAVIAGVEFNGPHYAPGSILRYRIGNIGGAGRSVGLEWLANSLSGKGVPHHVEVTAIPGGRNFSFSAAVNSFWQCTGDFIIDRVEGAPTRDIFFVLNNNTALRVGGNWRRAGSRSFFTPNGRPVRFNGNNLQTVFSIEGIETFSVLEIDKTTGDLQCDNTNIAISGTTGSILNLIRGSFDLNGRNLSFTAANGNITVQNGERRIFSSSTVSSFNINQTGKVVTTPSAGTLLFDNNVIVNNSQSFNFGIDLTTINHILSVNGAVDNTGAPRYGASSILRYNNINQDRTIGSEWQLDRNLSTQSGVPQNVEIAGTTTADITISFPGTPGGYRQVLGNLTITNTGTPGILNFRLGSSIANSADLRIGGNWLRDINTAFEGWGRAVTFNGAANQTITNTTAAENFTAIAVNKSAGNVVLNNTDLTINGTTGNVIHLQCGTIDLNGRLLRLTGNGGTVLADGGVRTIVNNHATDEGIFRIIDGANEGKVFTASGVGARLDFGSNVLVETNNTGANIINFNGNAVRIDGRLRIRGNGGAIQNGPDYGPNSILQYSTAATRTISGEWNTNASGPGVPMHVQVGVSGAGNSSALTINSGTRTVRGNISIGDAGGGTGYSLTLTGGQLNVQGNWRRFANGSFTPGTFPVAFTGSTASTIQAPMPAGESFHTLIFNKNTVDNTVTLNAPVTVTTSVTLTSGRVIASPANHLHVSNTAFNAISGGSANAYVDGSLRRSVSNVGTGDSYIFTVGAWDGSNHFYRPFQLFDITVSSGTPTFTGAYRRGSVPGGPTYFFGGTIRGILQNQWWECEQTTGGTADAARIVLERRSGEGFMDIFGSSANPPDITDEVGVMYRNAFSNWNTTGPPGTLETALPIVSRPEVRRNEAPNQYGLISSVGNISLFNTANSRFSLGWSRNQLLVLPIRLLSFRALLQNTDALLNWEVADAAEVQSFEVEYSTNGERFTKIATIPKGGTKYSYRHTKLSPGMHYYRLHMISKDGTRAYSAMELVQLGGEKTFIRGLHQNPVQGGRALIKVYSPTAQDAEAIVVDNLGRVLLRTRLAIPAGDNQVPLSVLPLSGGMYRLLLRTRDGVEKTLPFVR